MKRLLGLAIAMMIFSGCGDENQLNLGQNSDYFGHDGNKEMLSDSSSTVCGGPFSRALRQSKNKGISPMIEFTSLDKAVDNRMLGSDATRQQRCGEIKNYLSKGMVKVELSFLASEAEKKQMAHGKVLSMQPSRASLEYTDSSLKAGIYSVDLSCAGAFSVACDAHEIDGQKECASYTVSYSAQACKFRASSLPFGFSDHKNTELEIVGELELLPSGEAQLSFNKISGSGIY